MKEVNQLLLRSKNIPPLKIEVKQIDNSLIMKKVFNEDDLKPYIKTGARLYENIIELPNWDDESIFKELIPPWGFHKYVNYEIKEFGLGQVYIKLNFGKKYRKKNDYRFRDDQDVTSFDYYFLFDFNLRHYIQVNPDTNEEWQNRTEKMAIVEQQTFNFVWNYLTQLKPAFLKSHMKFRKNNSKTYAEICNFFDTTLSFLDKTRLYIDLLYIIYGDINQDEHFQLEQSIRHLMILIDKARKYGEQFGSNQLFDPHRDFKDRTNENHVSGIIIETQFAIENLFKSRKEKIDDNSWFAYNPLQGFLKFDRDKQNIYPTLEEVERRRSLYSEAANTESENSIINAIIHRLK